MSPPPSPEDLKKHISPTQLDSYTRCGEAYRRRYILGEKIPPSIAMIKGVSVHKSAEDNFKQKIESKIDLKKSEILERTASAFSDMVKNEGIWISGEELEKNKDKVLGDGKDQAVAASQAFISIVAPQYQPAEVEIEQKIALPESKYDLLGRLDLITDKDQIVDLKTSRKTLSQSDVDKNNQFSFYDLTYRANKGHAPEEIVIEQIVNKKSGAEVNKLKTSRDENDLQGLVNRINTMIKGLEAGIFMPATPNAWWCSKNFCGYWVTCSYVNNKKIRYSPT